MKSFFSPGKKGKSPKKGKLLFKPVRLPTKRNVKSISKKNLTWPQAVKRYPKTKMFGDADRDGKLNMFDCKPFDKKRHGRSKSNRMLKKVKGMGKLVPGHRGNSEDEQEETRRIKAGYTKIKKINAKEFVDDWEDEHKEKRGQDFAWNKERLVRAMERDSDDSYPRVSPSGDVEDGRHRISAAAEKGQTIDVAEEVYNEEG